MSSSCSPVSRDLINSSAFTNSSDSSSLDCSLTHSSVSPLGGSEGLESPEVKGGSVTAFAAARTCSSDGDAAYGGGGNDGNCTEGSRRAFAGGRGRGVAEVVLDNIVQSVQGFWVSQGRKQAQRAMDASTPLALQVLPHGSDWGSDVEKSQGHVTERDRRALCEGVSEGKSTWRWHPSVFHGIVRRVWG